MTNDLTTAAVNSEIMEQVLVKGDLAKLTAEQRSQYYMSVCKTVGLNPLTKPFEYITLNGKLTLYALRACTDQLRQLHGISTEVVDRVESDGLLIVHVRVKDRDGRQDEDYGAVAFNNLKGDAAANAIMKCVTKAKRRATLSLCGLGWLDESEIETIPGARAEPQPEPKTIQAAPKPAPKQAPVEPPINPDTGEVSPHKIAVQSKDGKFDFIGFGKTFLAAMKSSRNAEECDSWDQHNAETLAGMKNLAPQVYDRLMKALHEQVGYSPAETKPAPTKQVQPASQEIEGDII